MSRQEKGKSGKFKNFEGLIGGKEKGEKRGGTLSRPHSETDFSDLPVDYESEIDRMDEATFNENFEEMLVDMNLSEEKKFPLRSMPMINKKKLLNSYYKTTTLKPADYFAYLGQDLSTNKLYRCVESLRIALTNNPLTWVQEFGTNGLKSLLNILSDCQKNSSYGKIEYECVRCLRAIMNNTIGINQVFGQKEALRILARSMDINKPKVMLEAVRLLAAVCLIPPDGHDRAMGVVTLSAELKGGERFGPVAQGLLLKKDSNQPDKKSRRNEIENLRVGCLTLINAMVTQVDDLEYRLDLRNEILIDVFHDFFLKNLGKDAPEDLLLQINLFFEHIETDFSEWKEKFMPLPSSPSYGFLALKWL